MKKYLTDAEQQQLLNAAKNCTSPLAQRDYWWMRLCIQTGMRVKELSLLQAQQAEAALASGWLVMQPGQRKGGKRGHEYLVTQSVAECLRQLLRLQAAETLPADQQQGPAPLVWGREGQRLSVRSYQVRLQQWAQAAGLGFAVTPHWLRHTRAMNVLRRSRATNPLSVAQQALGHANISSTGIYTKMCREEYEADLRQIDGQRQPRSVARAQAKAAAQAAAGARA